MVNRDSYQRNEKKDRIRKLSEDISADSAREGFVSEPQSLHDAELSPPVDKKSVGSPSTEEPRALSVLSTIPVMIMGGVAVISVVTVIWTLILRRSDARADWGDFHYVGPLPADEKGFDYLSGELPEPSFLCERKAENADPDIAAQSYASVFTDSFKFSYEKNADEKNQFASIAKLIGALVVADSYDMDQMIGLLEGVDAEGNGMDLELGEKATVKDLLGAALVGSRNDAMYALAQNHPHGVDGFVEQMKSTALELGMQNTSVENVIGLDGDGQYSTARDVAILMVAVMRRPEIVDLLSRTSYTVDTSFGRSEIVWSTNSLLGRVDGVVAGKTGYTWQAGLSLVEYVDDDPDFVTVVFNADDRYAESERLIEAVREGYLCR